MQCTNPHPKWFPLSIYVGPYSKIDWGILIRSVNTIFMGREILIAIISLYFLISLIFRSGCWILQRMVSQSVFVGLIVPEIVHSPLLFEHWSAMCVCVLSTHKRKIPCEPIYQIDPNGYFICCLQDGAYRLMIDQIFHPNIVRDQHGLHFRCRIID